MLIINKVHRDLDHAAALQFKPQRLDERQTTVACAHRAGDAPRNGQIVRTQIYIESDQEWARAHDNRTGTVVQFAITNVGSAIRIQFDLLAQPLESLATD